MASSRTRKRTAGGRRTAEAARQHEQAAERERRHVAEPEQERVQEPGMLPCVVIAFNAGKQRYRADAQHVDVRGSQQHTAGNEQDVARPLPARRRCHGARKVTRQDHRENGQHRQVVQHEQQRRMARTHVLHDLIGVRRPRQVYVQRARQAPSHRNQQPEQRHDEVGAARQQPGDAREKQADRDERRQRFERHCRVASAAPGVWRGFRAATSEAAKVSAFAASAT
jgi:hypothetical protein